MTVGSVGMTTTAIVATGMMRNAKTERGSETVEAVATLVTALGTGIVMSSHRGMKTAIGRGTGTIGITGIAAQSKGRTSQRGARTEVQRGETVIAARLYTEIVSHGLTSAFQYRKPAH
jgi:hypothetical protein